MGGSFANWGLAFSCFDCSLQAIRKKVGRSAGALEEWGFLRARPPGGTCEISDCTRPCAAPEAHARAPHARRRTPGTPSGPAR